MKYANLCLAVLHATACMFVLDYLLTNLTGGLTDGTVSAGRRGWCCCSGKQVRTSCTSCDCWHSRHWCL